MADPVQVKQRVGYVPETHHIYGWMRVGEVLGFCKSCFRCWNDQTCREMLDLFGLDLEKRVKHLSKGMQTKLALLLAVSHEPELLFLDEPLSGLDPIAREEFIDGVLRTICDRGQTVLISSHMLDDVRRLADTVGILYEGQLFLHGNLDALLTSTKRIWPRSATAAGPSKRPRARSGSPFRVGSGRSPCGILRPKRLSRSRRSTASNTSRRRSGPGGTIQGFHPRAKGDPMKWLLWKDYRHNRLIVFTVLAILLGPHLIGLGVMFGGRWVEIDTRNGKAVYWTPKWEEVFGGASGYSLCISQLAAALIGGNAIAGERVDRSAEFLYSLPMRRRKLLASKLLFALAIAVAIWLINSLIFFCAIGGLPIPLPRPVNWLGLATIATTGLTLFCVAWFFSSFVASPVLAVCAGVITPVLVASGIGIANGLLLLAGLRHPSRRLLYSTRVVLRHLSGACLSRFRRRHVALSAAGGALRIARR